MPKSFGAKLTEAFNEKGQLCVGIDPHASLLDSWGLADSADSLLEFGRRVIDAASGRVGIVKPQVSFFERHGSEGFAALEVLTRESRDAGLLVIADAKRGDIGTTMDAYLDAWLGKKSPFFADSLTVSPYLGAGVYLEKMGEYFERGKGVISLVATSNPEGETVQLDVALVTDYLFKNVGLHRVEIDIRPENAASLRVVEKLGFRFEGLKERFIHINGAWRDHYVFALTSEEVPGGILNRWQHKKVPKIDYPWHSLKRKKNEHTAFNE